MEEMILTTENLSKSFKTNKAVDSVNLHIRKGSIYGLIGMNGAGKTTIMKMLTGMIKPTSGSFTYKGLGQNNKEAYSRIGALIEAPAIYPHLSAYDNLKLKCLAYGINDSKYIDEKLAQVGLADVGKKKAGRFSLGMKQRLGIAQALLHKPKLLICDEPTAALDPLGRKEILDALLAAKKETTVIFSTHILSDVERVCDRAAMLHNGVVTLDGTMEELHSRKNGERFCIVPKDQETYDVLSSMFLPFETLLTEKGERDVPALLWRHADEEDFRNVLTCVAEKKLSIEKAEWLGTTLEDMFLEVVRS